MIELKDKFIENVSVKCDTIGTNGIYDITVLIEDSIDVCDTICFVDINFTLRKEYAGNFFNNLLTVCDNKDDIELIFDIEDQEYFSTVREFIPYIGKEIKFVDFIVKRNCEFEK